MNNIVKRKNTFLLHNYVYIFIFVSNLCIFLVRYCKILPPLASLMYSKVYITVRYENYSLVDLLKGVQEDAAF